MALGAFVKWHRGGDFMAVVREMARLAIYPAATVLFFLGLSFAATGQWFTTGGFYRARSEAARSRLRSCSMRLRRAPKKLAGPDARRCRGDRGARCCFLYAALRRKWSAMLMPMALLASVALPFYAFYSGHPFRIRYEIPLILRRRRHALAWRCRCCGSRRRWSRSRCCSWSSVKRPRSIAPRR
jgi:hypothetical protein